jgi:hypothetical protein
MFAQWIDSLLGKHLPEDEQHLNALTLSIALKECAHATTVHFLDNDQLEPRTVPMSKSTAHWPQGETALL